MDAEICICVSKQSIKKSVADLIIIITLWRDHDFVNRETHCSRMGGVLRHSPVKYNQRQPEREFDIPAFLAPAGGGCLTKHRTKEQIFSLEHFCIGNSLNLSHTSAYLAKE